MIGKSLAYTRVDFFNAQGQLAAYGRESLALYLLWASYRVEHSLPCYHRSHEIRRQVRGAPGEDPYIDDIVPCIPGPRRCHTQEY